MEENRQEMLAQICHHLPRALLLRQRFGTTTGISTRKLQLKTNEKKHFASIALQILGLYLMVMEKQ
jgi:hypothetical protein